MHLTNWMEPQRPHCVEIHTLPSDSSVAAASNSEMV